MGKTPATTQDEPTKPREIDANGFELDEFGLPLVGPARIAALAGRPDPAEDPDGFAKAPKPAAPTNPTDPQEG
jgi:hypothetical protein